MLATLGPPPLSGVQLEQLVQVFLRVCDAVAFAHSRGVIHRDLKPSNIMVGTHGQVYVMDWGIAMLREGPRPGESMRAPRIRRAGDTLPEALGSLTGTPQYMAPEQARRETVDHRTDLYALGAIAYRALTGHPPFAGRDFAEVLVRVMTEMPERPSTLVRLPREVDLVLAIALAKNPADRFATATELADALEAALAFKLPAAIKTRAAPLATWREAT
jgi:serine/threonine-protein kinase